MTTSILNTLRARPHTWLVAIILVSLVLRVGMAFYMGDQVVDMPGVNDQISYDALAQRVLAGHGFSFGEAWWPLTTANAPTAHWSYLYTVYLIVVYAIFGHHPLIARLIQVLVAGVLAPWLTYRLAGHAFNRTVGLVAAAICAVYIYFAYYGAALMTETFFILGILWTLNQLEALRSAPTWRLRQWLWLGVAFGVTILLRQTFLPIVPLLGIWLWWAVTGRRRQMVGHYLLALLVAGLMILPCTVRNALAFKQFVLLNTNAGYAFFWANHPVHGTHFMTLLPPEIPYESLIPVELRSLDEAALEKALMKQGVQFVLDDPGRYLLLSANRLKDQFKFWPSPESGLFSNLSRVGSFGVFMPFMAIGIILSLLRRQPPGVEENSVSRLGWAAWLRTPAALMLGFFAIYTVIHLLSWAAIRYRLPTDAVTIPFAASAIVQIWMLIAPRVHRRHITQGESS